MLNGMNTKSFIYDPQKSGYDDSVWKTLSGTPAVASNKLRFNAAAAIEYYDVVRGVFNFGVNVPSAPSNALLTGGTAATTQMLGILTGGTSATSVIGTWNAVTDGEFAITIDGTAVDVTGLDFNADADMDAVAATIQVGLRAATGTLETVVWDTDHFIITAAVSASVTSAVSGGSGTDISGVAVTAFMDSETAVGTPTTGWNAVSDGEFAITIDAVAYDVTGIDFSTAADIDAVAALIQVAIRAETSAAETVVWDTDHFIITARTGITVTSAVSGGSGIDISGAGATTFMDSETAKGTVTDGQDKKFGLMSLNRDVYAMFVIDDVYLKMKVKDEGGTEVEKIWVWSSAWTAAEVVYSIKWEGTGVAFYANKVKVGTIDATSLTVPLSPYVSNGDSDNLDVGFIEGNNIDSLDKTILATNTTVTGGSEVDVIKIGGSAIDENAGRQMIDTTMLPLVTQYSPTHFNSVYTSNVTITLSDVNFTPVDVQVKYVIVNPTSPATAIYIDGVNGVSLTIASNVVTITGAGTPLVNTDTYEVGLLTKNIGDDIALDLKKTEEQAPINEKQTDPEAYTTLTAVDVNFVEGAVISTYGFSLLNYAFSKTASDADDSYLKINYLNAAGTVDHQETILGTTSIVTIGGIETGVTPIRPHVYTIDKAADVDIVSFPTKGYPYMRIDIAKVTDAGDNSTFTGEVNKSYL